MVSDDFVRKIMETTLDNRRRIDDLDEPELNIVVTLDDLISGVRGDIIRRETGGWAAYSAKGDGYALVGDGTDILSTLTPTWNGEHKFNAGIEFGGGSGINIIEIPDNVADAISIEDGGATEYLKIITTTPETRFNDGGVDIDFRIEASGALSAFFVRGSDGNVGLGTDTPDEKLHVEVSDTGIDQIKAIAKISHVLDGGSTAIAGMGASLEYELEDGAGNHDVAGYSAVVWLDPTSGSEDSLFFWILREAGTPALKAVLLNNGIFYASLGIRVGYSFANVSDPPTDAEVDAIWGSPTAVGNAFLGIINDNDDDTDIWLVAAAGSAWAATKLTVLV